MYRPKLLVINDVSERKRHAPLIRRFVRNVHSPDSSIVKASVIRNRVFSYLGKQPKYDLILLGDRGGTLLFTDRQLLRFGRNIKRVPYSMHEEHGGGWGTWSPIVNRELSRLGEQPRILILESDIGSSTHTVGKLAAVREAIFRKRRGAKVQLVAGAVTDWAKGKLPFSHVVRYTPGTPVRLSELMEKSAGEQEVIGKFSGKPEAKLTLVSEGRDRTYGGDEAARAIQGVFGINIALQEAKELLEKMQGLRKKRTLHTGTLPH